MGKFETTFYGILQILNDPTRSIDHNISILPKFEDISTTDMYKFSMTLTVLPNNDSYEISDYYKIKGFDKNSALELFYNKCILFLLFHQKNKKEKIYETNSRVNSFFNRRIFRYIRKLSSYSPNVSLWI